MYSMVLMAAMAGTAQAPDFGWRGCHGCGGYHGCWSSCYGCGGCYGGGWGSCYGGYYGGCYGGGWGSCYGFNGWGCGGWTSLCHGWGSACFGGVYGTWTYTHGGSVYAVPAATYGGAEAAPPPRTMGRAKVIIDVPADAKLYFDDTLMASTAEQRTFHTPELTNGQAYYYVVKAVIDRDGKQFEESKRLVVRGGQTVRESFRETLEAKARPTRPVEATASAGR